MRDTRGQRSDVAWSSGTDTYRRVPCLRHDAAWAVVRRRNWDLIGSAFMYVLGLEEPAVAEISEMPGIECPHAARALAQKGGM
jgi:hypothetical protein